MKKILALLLALVMVSTLAACGSGTTAAAPAATEAPAAAEEPVAEEPAAEEPAAEEPVAEPVEEVEIIVFAAASLTESLTAIQANYEAANPGVKLIFSFGSSGDLMKQIKQGAECDLFISAGQKQMNQIDITASADVNTDGSDFVVDSTRINLLENKVVLVVPDGNPKGVESFDQLAELLKNKGVLMAMGGEGVPVGGYTQKILAFYGLDEAELANSGCITYGADVKEVTTAVKEGNGDGGVIYASDAFSAKLTVLEAATSEMTDGRIIYPAALIKSGSNAEAAESFLAYLQTDEAMAEFEAVLFSPAP